MGNISGFGFSIKESICIKPINGISFRMLKVQCFKIAK
jgi:hypothetical protein